jgi:glycosyltransferase involved in cell wall biosynthesis
MKILHVSQNYYPSVGGPQYTMKHVSEKLVEYYGDTVQVCTTDSLYAPESKLYEKVSPAQENINYVEVSRHPFSRWHYPLITAAGKVYGKVMNKALPYSITKKRWGIDSSAMDKMLAKTNADVIMATTAVYNFADYPTWRFKTRNAKPFVLYGAIHLHVDLPENYPAVVRARACDCYIANTNFEQNKLIEYGVKEDKIVTIGTGIAIEDFEVEMKEVDAFKLAHGIEQTDVVLGYVGRLVKGKGVQILIDAFRKLYAENKSVKLLLAGGTTDYVPDIKKIMKEEELPIILIESFPEQMKGLFYNVLDIFVLASQSESFGVVFLEAWACKKPVIATRMGAISSLLTEGVDSLLFEAKNVDSLAEQLRILIESPGQRSRLGQNGYQKVADNFTWPTIVAKYREAYQLGIRNFESQYKNLKISSR